jgi:transglutaminase-like putative cysteine protease
MIAQARFQVLHETFYEYAFGVSLSQQLLRLKPRDFQFQQCDAHQVWLSPSPSESHEATDYFGNHVRYVVITRPHEKLVISAQSEVTVLQRAGKESLSGSQAWEEVCAGFKSIGNPSRLEPLKYLFASPKVELSDALADYARSSFGPGVSVLAGSVHLMERIHEEFRFDPQATDVSTPLSELFELKRGVCQDFAHFMIGCLRAIGLSARYVSGYIQTHPAPGKPRMIGADASHAWVSVYCPSIGWVDLDPTNRCMVNLEHITLGWGRDFSDVTLLQGVMLGGGAQQLDVQVTVTALPQPAGSCTDPTGKGVSL